MEVKQSTQSETTHSSKESVYDKTAVGTPERVDSRDEKRALDIEKAIAEQQDGLPAPVVAPEGGLKGWLTVIGA